MNLEATVLTPIAEEDPFDYGDRTVLQLRAQSFEVQDAFGTVVTMPIDTAPRNPLSPVPVETVFAQEDPIARLERKIDASLQQIAALQQRIESLDTTLARVLAIART